MAKKQKYYFGVKVVTVHPDGHIFVNGKDTGIRQWSDSRYFSSIKSGIKINKTPMDLESILKLKSWLGKIFLVLFIPSKPKAWKGFSISL